MWSSGVLDCTGHCAICATLGMFHVCVGGCAGDSAAVADGELALAANVIDIMLPE